MDLCACVSVILLEERKNWKPITHVLNKVIFTQKKVNLMLDGKIFPVS